MKTIALFALIAVLSASAHACIPTSPVMPTRIQLSSLSASSTMTAKAMGSVTSVPVVKGVMLVSNSEASAVSGQGFFHNFFDLFEDAYKWIKNHISFTYTSNNDGSSDVTITPSGGTGRHGNVEAY